VLGRFTLDGPDEYLRMRCSGALSLLVTVDRRESSATAVDFGFSRSTQG